VFSVSAVIYRRERLLVSNFVALVGKVDETILPGHLKVGIYVSLVVPKVKWDLALCNFS
jgi:hypothetical protein